VGHGGAEEGEERVAEQPHDGALVEDDGLGECLEGAADDLRPVPGVELLGECGGTDDIAEERGHNAALAADGRTLSRTRGVLGHVLLPQATPVICVCASQRTAAGVKFGWRLYAP